MRGELNHSSLASPSMATLKRKHCDVGVWDNPPTLDEPPHVTLTTPSGDRGEWESVDLTPNEARAVAAMLINAAANQDARVIARAEDES